MRRVMLLAIVAALLTACGGGGSGGGNVGGSSGSSSSSSSLIVSLSSTSGSASATEGNSANLTTTATVTGTAPAGAVANLQYDQTVFSSATATAGSTAGTYTISLQSLPTLDPGTYTGTVTFQLCADASCATVYPGSKATYTYVVTVVLQDWQTTQRNAAHTAYVGMTYDPTAFTQAWTWTSPGYLFSVATGGGLVYTSSNEAANASFDAKVYALKATDGSIAWSYDVPGAWAISQPASAGGIVTVTTSTASGGRFVWMLDAATGALKSKMQIDQQGYYSQFQLAAVPYGNNVFLHGGDSVGQTFNLASSTGASVWTANDTTAMINGQAPAVDSSSVYDYDGTALQVMDKASGNVSYRIADPNGAAGPNYDGAPILNGTTSVLAYSGYASAGGVYDMDAGDGAGAGGGRSLVRYNLSSHTIDWRSAPLSGLPALGNGVIYAGNNATGAFMAIRESDGTVLWTLQVPYDQAATPTYIGEPAYFHGNVIITKNLVFFSTWEKIYAVDISTHAIVWTYNSGGVMAISPENILYIASGGADYLENSLISNHTLVAIKLK